MLGGDPGWLRLPLDGFDHLALVGVVLWRHWNGTLMFKCSWWCVWLLTYMAWPYFVWLWWFWHRYNMILFTRRLRMVLRRQWEEYRSGTQRMVICPHSLLNSLILWMILLRDSKTCRYCCKIVNTEAVRFHYTALKHTKISIYKL